MKDIGRVVRSSVPIPVAPLVILVLGSVLLLGQPSTTASGVNYVVRTKDVPLYRKLIAFIDRDLEMRALANDITAGTPTGVEKAEALMAWVHTNIRPVPVGQPIVDDHPWHVVVRGYGTFDQAADVFAILATYAGLPGGLVFSRDADDRPVYGFAIVRIDGAWRAFDPREGLAFKTASGALARLDDLREDPSLTASLRAPREGSGHPYPILFRGLDPLPDRLRAYDQQLLPRIGRELERWLGR